MIRSSARMKAKFAATRRDQKNANVPLSNLGKQLKVSQYFGANVFDFNLAKGVPTKTKEELREVVASGSPLPPQLAKVVATAVTEWALGRGATHFCHWFQPLTGSTAEKHDAFIDIKDSNSMEQLSASQLVYGEPDASSFPHGGSRSTFEARGYTAWDITSPMFIVEGVNGNTLCIPTAFVSYHGDALDVKTPLLRSTSVLTNLTQEFLKLSGSKDIGDIKVTCGAEQEYFLIDKEFYYLRPDLVMTGRTLLGSLTTKNQQLDDHYFGVIPQRVLTFMQELEIELYRLGVPAKTRHNEVAPGQFELACIYNEANIAADHNQLVMATLTKVAAKHDFEALLHEKPFAKVNGSGKHINWSLATSKGQNLLAPGATPASNYQFLALISIILESVRRHAGVIRASIASAGNDHRLGANEAPPSVLSVYLGDTLSKIFDSIKSGTTPEEFVETVLDMGAGQLATILKDNTDRNRTSPLAFTGDKFEFRAPGSTVAVGFPLSIFNAAVADVMQDSNKFIQGELSEGRSTDEALISLTKKWYESASHLIFNGDGYSKAWLDEAAKRKLPNFRTTADALKVLTDEEQTRFLSQQGVLNSNEIKMRHNVLLERYITLREIEFRTMLDMVNQHILPAATEYKSKLIKVIKNAKEIDVVLTMERELLTRINGHTEFINSATKNMNLGLEGILEESEEDAAAVIANELMPLSERIADECNELENYIPDELWSLPKYFDMLFLR